MEITKLNDMETSKCDPKYKKINKKTKNHRKKTKAQMYSTSPLALKLAKLGNTMN